MLGEGYSMIWCINGYDVLLDDEDYERLSIYTYYINSGSLKKKGLHYFQRSSYIDGVQTTGILLHRDIMNCFPHDGKVVDHINGNTLDNRKCNLRICSVAENARNQKRKSTNTSGYKGVTWFKRYSRWRAQIMINGKGIHLGYYDDIKDAADAYNKASKELHGDFGRTN